MATGFKFMLSDVETDFNDVFVPRGTATAIDNTGFQNSSGTDFASIFLSGNSGITTGFQNSLGTDLGNLFAKKNPLTVTNATISGYSDDNQYYYAVFTNTINYGTINFLSYIPTVDINFLCIGGGGGGSVPGSAYNGIGGGAGGCVHTSMTLATSAWVRVNVGRGGSGQIGFLTTNVGTNGGTTSIVHGFVTKLYSNGGNAANYGVGGGGNDSYKYNQIVANSNGGSGGSGRNNGVSTSFNNPLPTSLLNTAALEPYRGGTTGLLYGGGGGGTYDRGTSKNFGAGQGGNGTGGAMGTVETSNPGNATTRKGGNGIAFGAGGGAGGYYVDIANTLNTYNSNGGNGKQGLVIAYIRLV